MARYVNMNSASLPPLEGDTTSIFSKMKTAGSGLNTNVLIIIGAVGLFIGIAIFYYFYYVKSSSDTTYHENHEQVPAGGAGQTAELMFFFADWCPHCKAAKPVWNDLKTEYENKTINGYNILFTEIDCSEETAEVEKLMNQYSVEGYPTIKLLKDGQVIEYDAKPSRETLVKFLNTVL